MLKTPERLFKRLLPPLLAEDPRVLVTIVENNYLGDDTTTVECLLRDDSVRGEKIEKLYFLSKKRAAEVI